MLAYHWIVWIAKIFVLEAHPCELEARFAVFFKEPETKSRTGKPESQGHDCLYCSHSKTTNRLKLLISVYQRFLNTLPGCVACALCRKNFQQVRRRFVSNFSQFVMCGWSQLRQENVKPMIKVCRGTSYSYKTENPKTHTSRSTGGMGERAIQNAT